MPLYDHPPSPDSIKEAALREAVDDLHEVTAPNSGHSLYLHKGRLVSPQRFNEHKAALVSPPTIMQEVHGGRLVWKVTPGGAFEALPWGGVDGYLIAECIAGGWTASDPENETLCVGASIEDAKRRCDSDFAARISPSSLQNAQGSPARDERQKTVAEWCAAAFGAEHQSSVPQRGLRFLEEAIEAYQALGGDPAQAHKLVDYIYAKEPGELFQELGGVGVTLLALAAAAGLSADDAERIEIERVLAKPLEHFWARNKVKNDDGFDALAYPSASPAPAKQSGDEK